MTKRELTRILKQNGWRLIRQGKHEVWGKDGMTIPIPRHAGDIPAGTARNILRRSGLDE